MLVQLMVNHEPQEREMNPETMKKEALNVLSGERSKYGNREQSSLRAERAPSRDNI